MWIDDQSPCSLDPAAEVPLHKQLGDAVRAAIADGQLPPGTRLPTEAQFQERFGISRSVVRQALSGLTQDGLIQRGRGRGSVVAPQHEHHRAVQKMSGLSTQISRSEGIVTTGVIQLEPATDPRAEAALGTSDLVSVLRLRSVGGEPLALIQTWLARSTVPGLEADDLVDASLHEILAVRYGVPVSAGQRQVRAIAASESIAAEMSVPVGAALLVLEGTSLDPHGRAVEYFCTWHRGDRVVFDVEATSEFPKTGLPTDTGRPSNPASTDDPVDISRRANELAEALREFASSISDTGAG
ncbi:GntR family transcriptional regulator [Brevibacterium epidermidis]|jgi:GntR family transcriptional regulator|uniref:GntR family transcriptional regulator n=1 Tax=Brevibacterium epidermidis TaxID=1698 RepID=A0ABV4EMZ2_BREEP